MNKLRRPAILAFCGLWALTSCMVYEHTNPLDPENPSSQRSLLPVVLAFVTNDTALASGSLYRKAYDAYGRLTEPVQAVSFEIPLDPETNSLKQFLKATWENLSGPRLVPRVFVGTNQSPLEGLSTADLHLAAIQSRLAPLLYESAAWTMEGQASVSGQVVTLEIKIARLGNANSGRGRVLALVAQKATAAWSQAAYAFAPHSLSPMTPAQIVTVTFRDTLASGELPAAPVFLALVQDSATGAISQGVRFE